MMKNGCNAQNGDQMLQNWSKTLNNRQRCARMVENRLETGKMGQ